MQRRWFFALVLCAAVAVSLGLQSLGWAIIPGGLKDIGIAVAGIAGAGVGLLVLALLRAPRQAHIVTAAGALAGVFVGFIGSPVFAIINAFTTNFSPWAMASFLSVAASAVGIACLMAVKRSGVFDGRATYVLGAVILVGMAGLLPTRKVVLIGPLESGTMTFTQWTILAVGLLCSIGVAIAATATLPNPDSSPTEQALQPDASASLHNGKE